MIYFFMDFLKLAKSRYSVRKFKKGEVPQEIIDKILEAGMIAPTVVESIKNQDVLSKIYVLLFLTEHPEK